MSRIKNIFSSNKINGKGRRSREMEEKGNGKRKGGTEKVEKAWGRGKRGEKSPIGWE